jgi:hypothetical protein
MDDGFADEPTVVTVHSGHTAQVLIDARRRIAAMRKTLTGERCNDRDGLRAPIDLASKIANILTRTSLNENGRILCC